MALDEDQSSDEYMKALEIHAEMDAFVDQLLKKAKQNPRPKNEQSIDEIIEVIRWSFPTLAFHLSHSLRVFSLLVPYICFHPIHFLSCPLHPTLITPQRPVHI